MTLSIDDGFKFGCGLILALVAFGLIVVILAAGLFFVAMLLNMPVPVLPAPR